MDQGHPDALQPLLNQLTEYLALELKFKPNLQLPMCSPGGEVTVGIRDGTTHVLRCLKVWYDMPSEVLFVAVNLVDRFLTKMKARPKHMACIAVASFQLAADLVCRGKVGCPPVPEAKEVAAISHCKCTHGDLERMQGIITTKLGTQDGTLPITAIDFLRIFHTLLLSVDEGHFYSKLVDRDELVQKLEVVVCDTIVSNFRPCEVALVVICVQMSAGVQRIDHQPKYEHVSTVVNFASQLQKQCQVAVASKNCPNCKHSFYEAKRISLGLVGDPSTSNEDNPSGSSRRTARVKREKPNYYDASEFEKKTKKKRQVPGNPRGRPPNNPQTSTQGLKTKKKKKHHKIARDVEEEDEPIVLNANKLVQCSIILAELNRKFVGTTFRV